MKQEISIYNSINLILWSFVGLLAGILLGNVMGLTGRELVFPAIVGLVIVTLWAYGQIFDGTGVYASKINTEGIGVSSDEESVQKEEANVSDVSTNKQKQKIGKIDGVVVTPLKTFPDDRGYFREMFRLVDSPLEEAAQVSATMSYPGVVKAFHYHNNQDDLWYCAKGNIQAVMYDRRPNSRTYGVTQVVPLGDLAPQTLFIPRGVVHGYQVLGPESATVIYATTQTYDPNDELRIPHDDEEIGYTWGIKPR